MSRARYLLKKHRWRLLWIPTALATGYGYLGPLLISAASDLGFAAGLLTLAFVNYTTLSTSMTVADDVYLLYRSHEDDDL